MSDQPVVAEQRPQLNRTRWAAIGAAVAVTLGAGGLGLVHAETSSPDAMPIYTAISPCRLADTRPAPDHVGEVAGALAGGATTTVTAADGNAHGNCTIPAGVTALALNVTALNATDPTFIQFAPGGTLVAGASSSLNPAPGQPPTPNAVNVPLSGTGTFDVYNAVGTVDVIFDVVGYFDDHVHDGSDIVDESLTGDDIKNHSVSSLDTSNEAGIVYRWFDLDPVVNLTSTPEIVASVPIRVPSNGYLTTSVSINWLNLDGGFDIANCQITNGTSTIDYDEPYFTLNDMDSEVTLALVSESSHRTMPISSDDNPALITSGQSINLVCDEVVGNVQIHDVEMTAQFNPTTYNPVFFTLPTIVIPFP